MAGGRIGSSTLLAGSRAAAAAAAAVKKAAAAAVKKEEYRSPTVPRPYTDRIPTPLPRLAPVQLVTNQSNACGVRLYEPPGAATRRVRVRCACADLHVRWKEGIKKMRFAAAAAGKRA